MIISYDDPVWAPCSGLANENRKWIFTSGSVVNSMVAKRVVTHVWASCRTIFLTQVVFPDPGIKRCQKCNLLQLSIHQCDPGSRRSHVFPAVTVEWFCSNSEIFILFIFKNNCQFLCFPIYFFAIFINWSHFLPRFGDRLIVETDGACFNHMWRLPYLWLVELYESVKIMKFCFEVWKWKS